MPTTTLPALITPQAVAEWLAEPTARVIRWAKAGKIPAVRLPSGDFLFDHAELVQWLKTLRGREVSADA
jgi:hypothetical protein